MVVTLLYPPMEMSRTNDNLSTPQSRQAHNGIPRPEEAERALAEVPEVVHPDTQMSGTLKRYNSKSRRVALTGVLDD